MTKRRWAVLFAAWLHGLGSALCYRADEPTFGTFLLGAALVIVIALPLLEMP